MSDRRRRRQSGGRRSKVAARKNDTKKYHPFIERKIPYQEILNEDELSLIEKNADILLEEIGIEFRDFQEHLISSKKQGLILMMNVFVSQEDYVEALSNPMPLVNILNMQEIQTIMLLSAVREQFWSPHMDLLS